MNSLLTILIAAAALWIVPPAVNAQGFVHRPHYIHERQLIPPRTPTYEQYFLHKYGRLPPYSRVFVPGPQPLPPGVTWSDYYVPGYGYVPNNLIVD